MKGNESDIYFNIRLSDWICRELVLLSKEVQAFISSISYQPCVQFGMSLVCNNVLWHLLVQYAVGVHGVTHTPMDSDSGNRPHGRLRDVMLPLSSLSTRYSTLLVGSTCDITGGMQHFPSSTEVSSRIKAKAIDATSPQGLDTQECCELATAKDWEPELPLCCQGLGYCAVL